MSPENLSVSRFELLMDAGFGAQKAGDILIKAFAHSGRHVYIEPMIPAEISPPARTRPALSGVIIRVADHDLTNIGNSTDLVLAQHEIVLDRRLDDGEQSRSCRILLDMGDQEKNPDSYEKVLKRVTKLGHTVFPFVISDPAKEALKALAGRGKNMYYLGVLSFIYGISEDAMIKEIKATFGKRLKEEIMNINIEIFHCGHAYASENFDFYFRIPESRAFDGHKKILIDGNTALSMGVIDAGIKLVSGYPITPASSILHTLAKTFPSYGGVVHQAEDEISAIGTAIGSYYGGVPSLTCTSGPGMSLKQEFIGYAAAAEIPVIIVDVQRSGPSTGMPTKTEQSDLFAAIYGSHGDDVKIVLSVSNVLDCFYAPHVARYLAERLKLPVFIMSDFQTANSYKVVKKPDPVCMEDIDDIPDFVLERFRLRRLPPVEDILMVRKHQENPGTEGGMRRVTGLNTDDEGKVNYFALSNERSHRVRNEKMHHVRRSLNLPEMFGPPEGDLLIVGWGSTRGALEEAIEKCRAKGLSVSGLHLRVVYPTPLGFKDLFQHFKKVYTVENAYGDEYKPPPLARRMRSETLRNVTALICGATGRPIQPSNIQERIKAVLKGDDIDKYGKINH